MELSATEETSVCRGQTIQERLANMRNASESWRSRVSKADSPEKAVEEALGQTPREAEKPRAVSTLLESRKSQLEDSQTGWKARVEEKDADQFTVEGRLRAQASPVVTRRSGAAIKRGASRAISFHGRPSIDDLFPSVAAFSDDAVRKLPSLAAKSPDKRHIRLDASEESQLQKAAAADEAPVVRATVENERRVQVPSLADEQVIEFLAPSRPIEEIIGSDAAVDADAFSLYTTDSPVLKCVVRTTRPPARRRRGQGNPVRRKNERQDLFLSEYTETVPGGKEQRRAEIEAKASEAAAAGLASRENIAEAMSVLRRADGDRTPARDCLPYKSLMLLQVKGQRQLQVRLVEPCPASLNSGDSFVLVSAERVFAWLGSYSNRMEQRRACDLAHLIARHKALGYRSSQAAVEVQEERRSCTEARLFWAALGEACVGGVAGIGDLEEDARLEAALTATNAVYEMVGDELAPAEAWWGRALRHEALSSARAVVLDFGSEVYVWLGKELDAADRRRAVALGRKLFQAPVDYRGCGVNPLCPLGEAETAEVQARPEWALFGRVSQHMETPLFTAKFVDWPASERPVSTRGGDGAAELDVAAVRLSLPDVGRMASERPAAARLMLEGTNLSRGGAWTAVEDGLRRAYSVDTRAVEVWRAADKSSLPTASRGQFHRQSAYVVRWHYRVHVGGRCRREEERKAAGIGRERVVYFYWQGRESSLNERGAAALLAVELDTEKGPQECVQEGLEPPAFCRLFPLMAVHEGRPQDAAAPADLFLVRGDREEEANLSAVPLSADSLRSRASCLLLCRAGPSFLWHGRLSPPHSRRVAAHLVEALQHSAPAEFRLDAGRLREVTTVEEGDEPEEVWRLLGGTRSPMPAQELAEDVSLRIWRFSAVAGSLRAGLVASPTHDPEVATALPHLQSDLYAAPQPAIFLLDGGSPRHLFLWTGWFNRAVPDDNGEEEGGGGRTTGSLRSQLTRLRLAALETAAQFGERRFGDRTACRVVYGGLEPTEVKELFPWWLEKPEATASQKMEGRDVNDDIVSADSLHKLFLSQRFSVERLSRRPLPEGVDPLFLEQYLEDEEFEKVFHVSRDDFSRMPNWKRSEMKKEAGLF